MKTIDIKDAIQEAGRLLSLPEYHNVEDALTIARKLIAQIEIIELKKSGYTNTQIGAVVGVNEKTIRFWCDADQCPNLNNAIALDELYMMSLKRRKT